MESLINSLLYNIFNNLEDGYYGIFQLVSKRFLPKNVYSKDIIDYQKILNKYKLHINGFILDDKIRLWYRHNFNFDYIKLENNYTYAAYINSPNLLNYMFNQYYKNVNNKVRLENSLVNEFAIRYNNLQILDFGLKHNCKKYSVPNNFGEYGSIKMFNKLNNNFHINIKYILIHALYKKNIKLYNHIISLKNTKMSYEPYILTYIFNNNLSDMLLWFFNNYSKLILIYYIIINFVKKNIYPTILFEHKIILEYIIINLPSKMPIYENKPLFYKKLIIDSLKYNKVDIFKIYINNNLKNYLIEKNGSISIFNYLYKTNNKKLIDYLAFNGVCIYDNNNYIYDL